MKNNSPIAVITTAIILFTVTASLFIIPRIKKDNHSEDICEHQYQIISQTQPDEFNPGLTNYKCSKCGDEKAKRVKSTSVLPQIFFNGSIVGIDKDSEVLVKAEYFDKDKTFQTFATMKYQGHTSMLYKKKNYTVKFYNDENKKEKNKVSFHGWKESNKFCLKANYIDFSQSRNIVSANIWSDVVATRKSIDKNIEKLQNYGSIDGYPVMVFINDEYQGIYTMNIPKDDDTYDIGNDPGEALFVINSANSAASHFKSTLSEGDRKSIFDLEYCYGENENNTEWAYQSLNNLISFVKENDGDLFKAGIDKYLDIDSAIDYLLTTYYLGLTDNFAKNALLLTYNGEKWIFSLYDMDTAFGLAFDGTGFFNPDYQIPQKTQSGKFSSSTDSLLWDKLLQNFYTEICERYTDLRHTVLQNDGVVKRYDDFIKSIPQKYYEKDLEIWGEIPLHNENNIEQIYKYLEKRSALLDDFFAIK